MDFLKRFFGSHNENHHYSQNVQPPDHNETSRQNDNIQRRGFDVFTDPLQMQQNFEHQMNEMLKMFGFQGFDHGIFSEFGSLPALQEESNSEKDSSKELRNQFLKSGYEKPSTKQCDRVDKDIDGKVHLGDLDSVFGRKDNISPYEKYNSNKFIFGQSQSIRTIRNADGSIETHRTTRDNEGNEDTTVCHKIGDKEYCLIKRKDKHGKEEIIENFVNMNESEKDILFNLKKKTPIVNNDQPHINDFPFDKFFK